ncbi:uncharacterized protein LOC144906829 [Branchiostoma floridae x Branchiostoma belcheri]
MCRTAWVLVLVYGLLLGVSGLGEVDESFSDGSDSGDGDEMGASSESDGGDDSWGDMGMGGDWGAALDGLRDRMGGDRDGGGVSDFADGLQSLASSLLSAYGMLAAARGAGVDGDGSTLRDRFMETWRTQCRPGAVYAPYACESDPCEGAVCSGQAAEDVHCVPDYCNARCLPVFYNKTGKGERVKCAGEQQGECPAVPYGYMGHCAHSCSSDDDCKAGQKCCSNGCGMQCIPAKFETAEDVSQCTVKLDEPAEDGSQTVWLFRPDERGGKLYSTDARGNGTSFAMFPGTRQEMAQAIRDGAAVAGAEVTVQDTTGRLVYWKVEDEKIYRGEQPPGGETAWRVVAVCNCQNCHMRGRQDGVGRGGDRDGGDRADGGGGMDREKPAGDRDGPDRDGSNDKGPGGEDDMGSRIPR